MNHAFLGAVALSRSSAAGGQVTTCLCQDSLARPSRLPFKSRSPHKLEHHLFDTMEEGNWIQKNPTSVQNNHNQQTQQNPQIDQNPQTTQDPPALALLEPAPDEANRNVRAEDLSDWYPNSIPLEVLHLEDSAHRGTIRMFAPDRYLEPQGDYYLADQLPEGIGNITKTQAGRCETCHQLLRIHPVAPPRFGCPNGCVFSSLSDTHSPHPGLVSSLSSHTPCHANIDTAVPPAVHDAEKRATPSKD